MAPRKKPAKRKRKSGVTEHAGGLTIRDADLKRSRPFEWAWDQRILLSYLNLQVGEEGVGKGNLTAWVAARITKGELAGDLHGEPRKVLFIGDEDAWDHIWVPRLTAAGADSSALRYVESGTKGVFDVQGDADALRAYITDEGIALVYFDQLLDNLGYADNWKDKEVRDKLAPIRKVAQDTRCAVLASMHPNKRGGSFRDRISGTPAFNALSRSSLLVARHPNDSDRAVVVRAKGNYSVEPQAFEFRIEGHALRNRSHIIQTSRITDTRETDLRRDDVLDATTRTRTDSQAGQARSLLLEMFPPGADVVVPAKDALERMAAEGFTARVAQEARKAVGLKTRKGSEFGAGYYWGYQQPKRIKNRRRTQ